VFRAAEARALAALLSRADDEGEVVVALGGGTLDNEAAVALLSGKSETVVLCYLDVPVETAWERISGDPGGLPPFLRVADPQAKHAALHHKRALCCRRLANVVVDCAGKAPEAIAETIAATIVGENTVPHTATHLA
jgi:shikimate kinase